MKSQGIRLFVGSLAVILVTTCTGFARGGSAHKASGRTTNITFASNVKLQNGTTLPAGTYRMEVSEGSQTPTVTFLRGSEVAATSPASLVSEASKNPATEIDSVRDGNAQDVIEIRPAGWKEALHFGGAAGQ